MNGFEDVTLSWKSDEFVVPASEQMRLIAKIEDALSGPSGEQPIQVLMRRQGPTYSRLATAYGTALRHAGARVTDEEIYLSIVTDLANGDANVVRQCQDAVIGLLSIIAPPVAASLDGGSANDTGKSEPAADS